MLLNFRIRKRLEVPAEAFLPEEDRKSGIPNHQNRQQREQRCGGSRTSPLTTTSMTRLDDICRLLRVRLSFVS